MHADFCYDPISPDRKDAVPKGQGTAVASVGYFTSVESVQSFMFLKINQLNMGEHKIMYNATLKPGRCFFLYREESIAWPMKNFANEEGLLSSIRHNQTGFFFYSMA